MVNGRSATLPSPPKHLESYARTARDLDQDFTGIYEWFNAAYIVSHHLESRPATFEDLETLRVFNDEGMALHPELWRLPFVTGMNYIGYSYEREREERLIEVRHAIDYLKRCARFSECPDTVPFTIAYLYRLEQELSQAQQPGVDATSSQIDFYSTLYSQTMEPGQRAKLALKLEELGLSSSEIAALDRSRIDTLKRHYQTYRSYLPLDLWTQIVYPQPDELALIPTHKENNVD